METIVYREMLRELKRECLGRGKPLNDCLCSLSCRNNAAWREGRSNCLTKVEPLSHIKDNFVSMKIHIK